MSQERLAELLGVTFQQVQKYEKGVNRIAASRLLDICAALDMPITQMFDGISSQPGKATASANVDRALATPGASELLKLFASVESAKVRNKMLNLARAIVKEETPQVLKRSATSKRRKAG